MVSNSNAYFEHKIRYKFYFINLFFKSFSHHRHHDNTCLLRACSQLLWKMTWGDGVQSRHKPSWKTFLLSASFPISIQSRIGGPSWTQILKNETLFQPFSLAQKNSSFCPISWAAKTHATAPRWLENCRVEVDCYWASHCGRGVKVNKASVVSFWRRRRIQRFIGQIVGQSSNSWTGFCARIRDYINKVRMK